MLTAILTASLVTVIAGMALHVVFRRMNPKEVASDYRQCAGGWHEAELNSCEQGLLSIPQQPVNTWTNLAYVAAGVFVAALVVSFEQAVFALTSAYLCVGSALYHATSTRWAGSLDVSAMYAVFSSVTVFAIARLLGLDGWAVALAMLIVAGLAAYLLRYRYKGDMQLKIGIFLGLAYAATLITMALRSWSPWPHVLASFASFAVAFVIWNLDKRRLFRPRRWGHGVWHLLTAAATALLFYSVQLLELG